MLIVQSNLAATYANLGRDEEAIRIKRDVYSGRLKLNGEEHLETLIAANNYAATLVYLRRFEEAKSLLRRIIPVARRVLGESDDTTFRIRLLYAEALYLDTGATLDDIREAVTTLEETEPIARRVLGKSHPLTIWIEKELRDARVVLAGFDAPDAS